MTEILYYKSTFTWFHSDEDHLDVVYAFIIVRKIPLQNKYENKRI